jgi:hypothetical protein
MYRIIFVDSFGLDFILLMEGSILVCYEIREVMFLIIIRGLNFLSWGGC